jgi:integrase
VLLDAGTGLRVGELLCLKWRDVDFENLELHIRRSVVHQVIGRCKTEVSAKPVPLDSFMAHDLLSWRRATPYNRTEDWVFASVTMKGTQPYWPEKFDAPLCLARRQAGEDYQAHRLAYLPSHILNVASCER